MKAGKSKAGMLALAAVMSLALAGEQRAGAAAAENGWIASWAAAPAPRWTQDQVPAAYGVPETLEGVTVRQVARLSLGGTKVRVVISNEYGASPLVIGAGSVALAGRNGALQGPAMRLTWDGRNSVVAPPGAPILSDPVDIALAPLSSLAVSLYLPQKTAVSSVHWDGAQTAYVSGPGDFTAAPVFAAASTLAKRLFLSAVLVDATPAARAVVFFGDSITDGACSTQDADARWPDRLAERLAQAGYRDVAVVNEAFSGDRVLSNGMGVNALARLNADVLSQPRLSTVVFMMGINDIGWPGQKSITPNDKEPSADDIIMGYRQIIDRVHAHGARIIGATLTPFTDTNQGTPTEGYYTPEKEKIRQAVNQWIRASGHFDGVIDFDKLLEDPLRPGHMQSAYDCGDHLHPNDAGYRAMAAWVDLNLLTAKPAP